MVDHISLINELRQKSGKRRCHGLDEATIREFLTLDPKLLGAIDDAATTTRALRKEFPGLVELPEEELLARIQNGFLNFYPLDQTNPYVPAGARGPWIVTTHGAVLHDSGGYGMLGFGHAPDSVLAAMGKRQVMANIMTPSFSQMRFMNKIRREIGHARGGETPYARFLCLNSGSEAVTVALRISDLNAKKLTDHGARHHGKRLMFLAVQGGFHGRTERPAQASSSSRKYYEALASFRGQEFTYTVPAGDIHALKEAFAWADANKVFFEAMLLEPVMGEGNPGLATTPSFFAAARELTAAMGSMLVVDSIQAGLRATGCLSITDYPGFEKLPPPDMETYSKALNAGQYPLSVVALTENAAALYQRGVYGNTKTANPRALDVASAVLDLVTPAMRRNVQERGLELLTRFARLQEEFPEAILKVQGTGLLCAIEMNPKVFQVTGVGQLEEWLRLAGIGVIHGGTNALRFTPHFGLSSREAELLESKLRLALKTGPRLA